MRTATASRSWSAEAELGQRVIERKNDVTIKHTKGLEFLMKKNKITVFNGHGRLTGPAKEGVHITSDETGKPKDAQARATKQGVTR